METSNKMPRIGYLHSKTREAWKFIKSIQTPVTNSAKLEVITKNKWTHYFKETQIEQWQEFQIKDDGDLYFLREKRFVCEMFKW